MTGSLKDTGCKPQSHGESSPGGGPCPRCGRPRCSAASKGRPGERCRNNPHPGATICGKHGLTEKGRAAAAQRRTEAAAADLLGKLIWNPSAAPVTDNVGELRRLMGAMRQAADVLGDRLNGGVCEHCHRGPDGLDGATGRAWIGVLRELRQGLEGMERLGLAERQVELQQAQAQLVTSAFLGALAAVSSLLPADRDAMVRAFLGGLGRGPELLEVANG